MPSDAVKVDSEAMTSTSRAICCRTARSRVLCSTLATIIISCSGGKGSTQECSPALVVLPEARNVRCETSPEQQELVYEVSEPWPATQAIETIKNTLQAQGWKPILNDFLNPGVPSSHVVGWQSYQEDDSRVRQWLGQWNNEQGQVAWYALTYRTAQEGEVALMDLKVQAVLLEASVANVLQERPAQSGTASSTHDTTPECEISDSSFMRVPQPSCVVDEAISAAPRRFGDLYNLALLGTATVRTDSPLGGQEGQQVRDGWYGECSAWMLDENETAPTFAELDLGRLFEVSGIAITAHAMESESTPSWRVEVMAGLAEQSLSRIDEYEGPVFNGKRLFSFQPTAMRVVRIRIAFPTHIAAGVDGAGVFVDEVEVFGNCIR